MHYLASIKIFKDNKQVNSILIPKKQFWLDDNWAFNHLSEMLEGGETLNVRLFDSYSKEYCSECERMVSLTPFVEFDYKITKPEDTWLLAQRLYKEEQNYSNDKEAVKYLEALA